jgi:effector-binding domain-containing protein
MLVDFVLKRVPSVRVASIVRVGPWKEDNLRTEFGELTRWAGRRRLTTGRWIFLERDRSRWEACLEISGDAPTEGRIRRKTLPATSVASVTFDPDQTSSRIVYHALRDWTRSRARDGTIRAVTAIREIYSGDPWRDKCSWASCEVQFLVRREARLFARRGRTQRSRTERTGVGAWTTDPIPRRPS